MRKYGEPKASRILKRHSPQGMPFYKLPQEIKSAAMFVRGIIGDDIPLYIAGSIGRGQWDEKSDLDIVVSGERLPIGTSLYNLSQGISMALGVKIDLSWRSETEDWYIEIPPLFVKN